MNALIELREIMKRNQLNFDNIRCAHISYGVDVFHEDSNYIEYEKSIIDDFKEFILVDTHNNEDLAEFLRFLDFEYNDGYGGQNLFGKIWFYNSSWLERHDYDGSEWWEYKKFEVPKYLQK